MKITLSKEKKESIEKEAKKEEKTISQYLADIHFAYCAAKYNRGLTCPHCGAVNQAEKIICWDCGKEF